MERSIGSHKSKHVSDHSYHKRQTLGLEFSFIEKCREDKFCRIVVAQVDQWNQNSEEAENMEDENQSFEFRKETAGGNIDKDCKCNHGPDGQR